MTQSATVEFALSGTAQGVEISPTHVPFGLMRKFHDDVEKLVLGSNQGSLADTLVEVRQGSYALVVPIPENVRESFERDIAVATEPEAATHPDPTRLGVLQSWKKRAEHDGGLTFYLRPQAGARIPLLRIDAQTVLRRSTEDRWVPLELLLVGRVLEAGGAKTNIHVRLRDQPQSVIVAVDWNVLEREAFPFTGDKLLRVTAERNQRTRALRKLRLLEFVAYKPEFDEAAFTRMTTVGEKAWADVPDAAKWVREQRD
ncbi:MAG: hypothetical protein C0518_09620 [Opitutus sp.]|nr:hypothetical protein [Opitutus sp.]